MNERLFSDELHNSIPGNLDIFGRFLGEWHLDLTITNPDGTRDTYKGEWHFHRILQGRAIQDIWMIPDMASPGENAFFEYGTTIRTFNSRTQKWKAVWVGPMQNQLWVFDVEDKIDQIILSGSSQPQSLMRWIFFDISSDSFQWRSEVKFRESDKWFINYHMLLSKK